MVLLYRYGLHKKDYRILCVMQNMTGEPKSRATPILFYTGNGRHTISEFKILTTSMWLVPIMYKATEVCAERFG